jgi:surface polysaccharide O-acyltransferase-like enzyme
VVHSVSSYITGSHRPGPPGDPKPQANLKNRAVLLLFVASVAFFAVFAFLSNFTSLKGTTQPYAFLVHLVFVSVFYWATFWTRTNG